MRQKTSALSVFSFDDVPIRTGIWYPILQFQMLFSRFTLLFLNSSTFAYGGRSTDHHCQHDKQHLIQRMPYAPSPPGIFYPLCLRFVYAFNYPVGVQVQERKKYFCRFLKSSVDKSLDL